MGSCTLRIAILAGCCSTIAGLCWNTAAVVAAAMLLLPGTDAAGAAAPVSSTVPCTAASLATTAMAGFTCASPARVATTMAVCCGFSRPVCGGGLPAQDPLAVDSDRDSHHCCCCEHQREGQQTSPVPSHLKGATTTPEDGGVQGCPWRKRLTAVSSHHGGCLPAAVAAWLLALLLLLARDP